MRSEIVIYNENLLLSDQETVISQQTSEAFLPQTDSCLLWFVILLLPCCSKTLY